MGLKKDRRVRKIEVPTDSVPELELEDTGADIQWRREERKAREKEEAQKQRKMQARSYEARTEEKNLQEDGVPEKRTRTEKSDTETEPGRETRTSQS